MKEKIHRSKSALRARRQDLDRALESYRADRRYFEQNGGRFSNLIPSCDVRIGEIVWQLENPPTPFKNGSKNG